MMDDLQFSFSLNPILEIMAWLGTVLDIVSVGALCHSVLLGGQPGAALCAGFPRIRFGINWHRLERVLLVEFHFVSFQGERSVDGSPSGSDR